MSSLKNICTFSILKIGLQYVDIHLGEFASRFLKLVTKSNRVLFVFKAK